MKCKEEALEKLRIFETEELETFVNFKLKGRPEAFQEVIDHMKYYEEANKAISGISVQENNAENVSEDKTVKFVPLYTSSLSNGRDETGRKDQKNQNQNNFSEILTKVQKKKETCKFLKTGKCKHGWSGNKPDQEKICSYNHPPVCKKHEKFGRCFDNRCKKLHLSICREYMNTLNCKYGENCKFFHPTGLEDFRMGHERKKPYSSQENPTELKNTRIFYGRNQSYLRQGNQMQHPFLDLNQGQNTQGTFLEFMEGQKESQKEILRRLEQLELQKNQLQSPQK